MSNNKQSSVEWLESIVNAMIQNGGDTDLLAVIEHIQKAKAMHKEEIEKAWLNGADYRDLNGQRSTYLEINLGEQPNNFYNETYGNTNSN